MTVWRALKSVLLVIACWSVATHLEDLARFLKMRDMSNPSRYPPATSAPETDRA